MRSNSRIMLAIIVVATLLAVLGGSVLVAADPIAAPLPAPTPASNTYAQNSARYPINFWLGTATNGRLIASGASTAFQMANVERMDLQYKIDETTTNTITLKLQFSNDNVTWSDGVNIVASAAADTNGMLQLDNFGLYTRAYATVANTNPVTVTLIAVGKQ